MHENTSLLVFVSIDIEFLIKMPNGERRSGKPAAPFDVLPAFCLSTIRMQHLNAV